MTTTGQQTVPLVNGNNGNGSNGNGNNIKPFVRIVEQPAKCAIRFRYECEGRSAGSIPGVNATPENKTFPTIQVCNYRGKAVVVVSCVTKEPPYRPHPHNLVGKEGCKKGVCTLVIDNNPEMICTFTSLGIQCVKRNKIEESLKLREMIKVDPFRTGFAHRTQASSIDLNCLRLCFQVFIEGPETGKFTVQLPPIVSDAIYDKKAMAELIIVKLSHYSAPCTGGKEIILLCDRVAKDDIQVRFVQEASSGIIWEAFGEFLANDVHKQVAISLRTPKYFDENISQPVTVHIQLRRPSDGCLSLPRSFQITPRELDPDGLVRKRHKRLKEENYDLLQEYIQLATGQTSSTGSRRSPSGAQSQVPTTGGITIKTEILSSVGSPVATATESSPSRTSSFQQPQYSHSPQHILSDASSSGMSPIHQQQYVQTSQPTQYSTNDNNNSYTSPSYIEVQQSPPNTTNQPQQSTSTMAYALAASMVASSPTIGGSPLHHHPQQYVQQRHQTSPNPSYPSPTHSPAMNQYQQQHLHQQNQQQQAIVPNEVMERFDSLDIDSSELIPDLDFNSNTMLSLMMDTSSGLSLNDSFSDITNNNNNSMNSSLNHLMVNGNATNNNGQQSTSSAIQASRAKLKLNLQQQQSPNHRRQNDNDNSNNNNNNHTIPPSLDTPIIELLTNSGSIASYDNLNNNNNTTNNSNQMFSALDLDNNNHLTHLN